MTNRLHAMRKSNFTKHDPGGWKCIGNAEGRHAIRPPGLRHDGGWIPPGVQAFGDLARQPWRSSDGGKGGGEGGCMSENSRGWLQISSWERRAHRDSDGNEIEMGTVCFDLSMRRDEFYKLARIREYFDNFENRARYVDDTKENAMRLPGIIFWFYRSFPTVLKISVNSFEKLGNVQRVRTEFEDFRSPKFVDIGRILRVPVAIENFVVNGASEKSRVHRPESRICACQSMGFHAITATVLPFHSPVLEGFVKKNRMETVKVERARRERRYKCVFFFFSKITINLLLYNSSWLCAHNCFDRYKSSRRYLSLLSRSFYFIQSLTVFTQFVIKRFFEHKENT